MRNLSFQKFLLITGLLIIMIVGIALLASGDKKSGIKKDEYYISGGTLIGLSLFIFVMGKLSGLITFTEIFMTLYVYASIANIGNDNN
jgi:uncharacterized membrane protein